MRAAWSRSRFPTARPPRSRRCRSSSARSGCRSGHRCPRRDSTTARYSDILRRRTMQRRALLAALALFAAAPVPTLAQDAYPNKPIRLVVPFPPSGGTDVLSRAMAQAIGAETSWNFVVDNRPGAGGNIGLEAAAKAPPDGYTIAMGQTSNLAVNPTLYSKIPYDPIKDFAPIALVSSQPLIVVVAASSPYRTLK